MLSVYFYVQWHYIAGSKAKQREFTEKGESDFFSPAAFFTEAHSAN